MMASLTEIQFMTRRACIGAGYPHGLAGSASRATRWLCGRGLPGLESLLWLLKNGDPGALCRATPHIDGDLWRWPDAGGAPLSPIELGPVLAELPVAIGHGRPAVIELECVLAPLVLLPWVSALAVRAGHAVSLAIKLADGEQTYLLRPDGTVLGLAEPAAADGPAAVRIRLTGEGAQNSVLLEQEAAPDGGVPTPEELWAVLNEFAHRGYVAATEESRLRGAGAGQIDND